MDETQPSSSLATSPPSAVDFPEVFDGWTVDLNFAGSLADSEGYDLLGILEDSGFGDDTLTLALMPRLNRNGVTGDFTELRVVVIGPNHCATDGAVSKADSTTKVNPEDWATAPDGDGLALGGVNLDAQIGFDDVIVDPEMDIDSSATLSNPRAGDLTDLIGGASCCFAGYELRYDVVVTRIVKTEEDPGPEGEAPDRILIKGHWTIEARSGSGGTGSGAFPSISDALNDPEDCLTRLLLTDAEVRWYFDPLLVEEPRDVTGYSSLSGWDIDGIRCTHYGDPDDALQITRNYSGGGCQVEAGEWTETIAFILSPVFRYCGDDTALELTAAAADLLYQFEYEWYLILCTENDPGDVDTKPTGGPGEDESE